MKIPFGNQLPVRVYSKMKKNNLLIRAAKDNDLKRLIKLSDTAKLIKCVQRATGNNLLQIAVLSQSQEVFHHLLTIEDYPLNHKNKKGQTALNLCFDNECVPDYLRCLNFDALHYLDLKMNIPDHFACELIKNCISVDCVTLRGNETLLHHAIERRFVQVPKLLMHLGYDVNARNDEEFTPLGLCINRLYANDDEEDKKELIEIVSALLCYGVDLTMETCLLEHAVMCRYYPLQETLFNFIMDDFTSMDVSFRVLMTLALDRSPHFRSVIEHSKNVIIEGWCEGFYHDLFKIDPDYLNILITTCPEVIRQVSCEAINFEGLMDRGESGNRLLDNLSLLLESDLGDDFIQVINDQLNVHNILQYETDESVAFERICLLLSYGITINEYTLNTFYGKFGFGELFKLVVDMKIQPLRTEIKYPYCSKPIYSVHFDLEQILDKLPSYHDFKDVLKLLQYFSNPKLRELCFQNVSKTTRIVATAESQPKVPLLLELARNVCQKFLVKTFQIETPMQFYKLVNKLPVPQELMKIIRLERRIY